MGDKHLPDWAVYLFIVTKGPQVAGSRICINKIMSLKHLIPNIQITNNIEAEFGSQYPHLWILAISFESWIEEKNNLGYLSLFWQLIT